MFHVVGKLKGDSQERSLLWDDGRMTGSPGLVGLVLHEAARLDGYAVGPAPSGPFTYRTTDHLNTALSVLTILGSLLEPNPLLTGDVPAVTADVSVI